MPNSIPLNRPMVVANLDNGSIVLLTERVETSVDGRFVRVPDESATYDVSRAVVDLAVELRRRRNALQQGSEARALIEQHVDVGPKQMLCLTDDGWRELEQSDELTGPVDADDERRTLRDIDERNERPPASERAEIVQRTRKMPEAEIEQQDGRYFAVFEGQEHDVTSSVAPILRRLEALDQDSPTPSRPGASATNGWHEWALEPTTRSHAAHLPSPNSERVDDGMPLHFTSMSLESVSPDVVSMQDQVYLKARAESFLPPSTTRWTPTPRRFTMSGAEEVVRRLRAKGVELYPMKFGSMDPLLCESTPDRRDAVVLSVPSSPENDARIADALRDLDGVNPPVGRSLVTPNRRPQLSVSEWATKLGPVVIRKCSPAEWSDIQDDPTLELARRRNAAVADQNLPQVVELVAEHQKREASILEAATRGIDEVLAGLGDMTTRVQGGTYETLGTHEDFQVRAFLDDITHQLRNARRELREARRDTEASGLELHLALDSSEHTPTREQLDPPKRATHDPSVETPDDQTPDVTPPPIDAAKPPDRQPPRAPKRRGAPLRLNGSPTQPSAAGQEPPSLLGKDVEKGNSALDDRSTFDPNTPDAATPQTDTGEPEIGLP